MTTCPCLDCGALGPWANVDNHGKRCPRCVALYRAQRSAAYRYARLGIPRPHGRCAVCGSREGLTWDHIVPVSRGGKTVMSNLRVLCRPCNSRKGNRR